MLSKVVDGTLLAAVSQCISSLLSWGEKLGERRWMSFFLVRIDESGGWKRNTSIGRAANKSTSPNLSKPPFNANIHDESIVEPDNYSLISALRNWSNGPLFRMLNAKITPMVL